MDNKLTHGTVAKHLRAYQYGESLDGESVPCKHAFDLSDEDVEVALTALEHPFKDMCRRLMERDSGRFETDGEVLITDNEDSANVIADFLEEVYGYTMIVKSEGEGEYKEFLVYPD